MCFVPRLNTERLANVLEENIRKENGELDFSTKIFHTLQIKVMFAYCSCITLYFRFLAN